MVSAFWFAAGVIAAAYLGFFVGVAFRRAANADIAAENSHLHQMIRDQLDADVQYRRLLAATPSPN